MATKIYNASDYGTKEEELLNTFRTQRDDAKLYFENIVKPRLDRSYKLYIADTTDRANEIEQWQSNVAVPYVHAVVETLKPRILDARPEFTVQGRTPEDQPRAFRVQSLCDYNWEIADGDKSAELVTSAALINGMGYLQVSWKKDERKLKFLNTKDIAKKKYTWSEKKQIFYDAPYVEWVDNYGLWYDWHNVNHEDKQYWFKRLLLTKAGIERRYPMADKKRLQMAIASNSGCLIDYAAVRSQVKIDHEKIIKGDDHGKSSSGVLSSGNQSITNEDDKLHEVFEWLRPLKDSFAVIVNDIPILKGSEMPNPYDFKETFFIGIPYLQIPGEYEGYGLPLILENPQIMLNMVKNQRLDAATLSIHKMWIVNPLANINKDELISRPFGIVYSTDPNGAREIQMSDIKPSAYKEEELLKSDMRYASGVDDFSMGVGGGAGSATEVRHLRESTLERVRLFINHLGEGYAKVIRYWISMYRQFYSEKIIIRIVGDNGELQFPIIEKDDLRGEFDFKATVLPSLAGQNDIKRKQDMDLFQLLINLPFVDPEKLTAKVLHDWNWNLESVVKGEELEPPTPPGMVAAEGEGMMAPPGGAAPAGIAEQALALLGDTGVSGQYAGEGSRPSVLAEMRSPVNLLKGGTPPTPRGVPTSTSNPRGMNRSGKVNTNIAMKAPNGLDAQLQNRALNIQR